MLRIILLSIISLFATIASAQSVPTFTFTVTKTTDPDPFVCGGGDSINSCTDINMIGSLQWAIRKANAAIGSSIINFDIPGSGPHIIKLNSLLPPIATNQIIIDASTQVGYQLGKPSVVIDGNDSIQAAFIIAPNTFALIKGFYIKNFLQFGILTQSNCEILDNVINAITEPSTTFTFDIIIGSASAIVKGNILGTDANGTSYSGRNGYFGIFLVGGGGSIGDTTAIGKNIIAYHDSAGVVIDEGLNVISGNEIYNNPKAIELINGGNDLQTKPIINIITTLANVTGTSTSGSTIELFGSTGPENANQYLTTVITDTLGHWFANLSAFRWCWISATATTIYNDLDVSTSELAISNFLGLGVEGLNISVADTNVYIGQKVIFTASYGCTSDSIVGTWDFNTDGFISGSTTSNPSFATYGFIGTYTVSFTVPAMGLFPEQSVSKVIHVLPFIDADTTIQQTFTVTKTTDPDPFLFDNNDSICDISMFGTLQWAMRKAIATATGISKIIFNIPGSGPHTISLNQDLPFIERVNPVIIDASTQTGYQHGSPAIIIDGHHAFDHGFALYDVYKSVVKGFYIKNFNGFGVFIGESSGCKVLDNVINNIHNFTDNSFTIDVFIEGGVQCVTKGNILGTDANGTDYTAGNAAYGVVLYESLNLVGDTSAAGQNIIAYHDSAGVYVGGGGIDTINTSDPQFLIEAGFFNKISRNKIFQNGPKAINLFNEANMGKSKPLIDFITNLSSITGTAAPGDIVELFGSTGPQNANKYLKTVITDNSGHWSANLSSSTWCYISATATDANNNTSELTTSNFFATGCQATPPPPCTVTLIVTDVLVIGGHVPPPPCVNCIGSFAPEPGKYIVSAWVKEDGALPTKLTYTYPQVFIQFPTSPVDSRFSSAALGPFVGQGVIIDGWQRVEAEFTIPTSAVYINLKLNSVSGNCFFDDIRIFPFDGSMKSYVYDPVNLRLVAELDERNYATMYEYDEEGKLIRVKKETEKGVMTIKENRNSTIKK